MELVKQCTICEKDVTFKSKWGYKIAKDPYICRVCTCVIRNTTRDLSVKDKNSMWKGYKEIPYTWFSSYFERGGRESKKGGSLTIEEVYDLWINQGKKCKLSGLSIGFYDDGKKHTCSIDRIDSSKGYELGNVQLVHKHINIMKNAYDNSYFIEICRLITNNNQ